MKKCLVLLMLVVVGVSVSGCSSKKKPDVEIVRENITDDEEQTSESEEPVSTEEPDSTEEPVSTEDTEKDKEDEVVDPEFSVSHKVENEKGELDPNADALDAEGTGDVVYTTGDSQKFTNNDEFLNSVPSDLASKFNDSVQSDILDKYPDLTFVSYDEATGNIYAKSENYYFNFMNSDTGYNTSAELKKYADWWTFD